MFSLKTKANSIFTAIPRAALVMFAISAVLLSTISGVAIWSHFDKPSHSVSAKPDSSKVESKTKPATEKTIIEAFDSTVVVNHVNDLRTSNGMKVLTVDQRLESAAQAQAAGMIATNSRDVSSTDAGAPLRDNQFYYSIYKIVFLEISKHQKLSEMPALLKSDNLQQYLLSAEVTTVGASLAKNKAKTENGALLVVYLASPANSEVGNTPSSITPVPLPSPWIGSQSAVSQPSTGLNYQPAGNNPTTPSCETMKHNYTSQHNAAVSEETRRYNTAANQIQSLILQLGMNGAGHSSAMDQAIAMRTKNNATHAATISNLIKQHSERLATLNC